MQSNADINTSANNVAAQSKLALVESFARLSIGSAEIRQLDGLYSLNDLHQADGGEEKHRPTFFLRADQTQDLITEIGNCAETHSLENAGIPAIKTTTGRNGGTYACRELVIAYAAWISAAFHLKVIRVFLNTAAPTLPSFITTAEAGELATLIAERFPDGRDRPYAWSRFNRHFRLSGYKTLPSALFADACDYIRTMPNKEALPNLTQLFMPPDGKHLIVIKDGKVSQTRPVPMEACVLTQEEMLKAIHEPNGLFVTTPMLAEFALASVKRLAARCEYFEKQSKTTQTQKGKYA